MPADSMHPFSPAEAPPDDLLEVGGETASASVSVACGEAVAPVELSGSAGVVMPPESNQDETFYGYDADVVQDMVDLEEMGEKTFWPAGANVIEAKGWLASRESR